MIVKLDNTYNDRLMKYLKKEPEFNLFIIGDIDRYGYNNYFFNIWGDVNTDGEIEGILVKYFDFIIVYSYSKFNIDKFINLINRLDYCEISGKAEIVNKLSNRIDLRKIRTVNLSKLDKEIPYTHRSSRLKVKKVRFGNLKRIVRLYELIDEFENTNVDCIKNGLKTGRGYCIEVNKQVVAMAKSTSENKTHAMIVGVGTHPNFRNKGLATRCIVRICNELLSEGKIPCLFYDNEEAGKIYKKLGFKNIGFWSIGYK